MYGLEGNYPGIHDKYFIIFHYSKINFIFRTVGNLIDNNQQNDSEDNQGEDTQDSEVEYCNEEFIDDVDVQEYLNRKNIMSPSNSTSSSNGVKHRNTRDNQKRKTPIETDLMTMLSDLKKAMTDAQKDDSKEDLELNYCMTMYAAMKRMSKKKQKEFRFQISQLLHQLESDSE